jgi:UDP-N-acetyl-D-glucosamine dehydrogenase
MRGYDIDLTSEPLTPSILEAADCVLIVTDHDAVDWDLIGRHAGLVVDTRNAMAGVDEPRARIVKA